MLFSGNLRRDYELLHMLEKEHKENGKSDFEIAMRPMVKQLKEGIRNTHRERERWEKEEEYKWKSYRDYWDERYCKTVYAGLPEDWYTEEDEVSSPSREEAIKQFIEDEWCHWYNPYGDGRDCTGVWFTSSIYVFPIPALNITIVYHIQSCDV